MMKFSFLALSVVLAYCCSFKSVDAAPPSSSPYYPISVLSVFNTVTPANLGYLQAIELAIEDLITGTGATATYDFFALTHDTRTPQQAEQMTKRQMQQYVAIICEPVVSTVIALHTLSNSYNLSIPILSSTTSMLLNSVSYPNHIRLVPADDDVYEVLCAVPRFLHASFFILSPPTSSLTDAILAYSSLFSLSLLDVATVTSNDSSDVASLTAILNKWRLNVTSTQTSTSTPTATTYLIVTLDATYNQSLAQALHNANILGSTQIARQSSIQVLLTPSIASAYVSIASAASSSSSSSSLRSVALMMDNVLGVIGSSYGALSSDFSLSSAWFQSSPGGTGGGVDMFTRSYMDAMHVVCEAARLAMVQGTAGVSIPLTSTTVFGQISSVGFLGASGSFSFISPWQRRSGPFEIVQISSHLPGGSTPIADFQHLAGLSIHDPSYRNDIINQTNGGVNFPSAMPPRTVPLIPGFWQWVPIPESSSPPSPRFGSCQLLWNDTFWVFFGMNDIPSGPLHEVWKYSIHLNLWTKLPILGSIDPRAFYFGSCSLFNDFAYFVGGASQDGIAEEVWSYDFRFNTFFSVPVMLSAPISVFVPVARSNAAFATIGSQLWMWAGYHAVATSESFVIFDMESLTLSYQVPSYSNLPVVQPFLPLYEPPPNMPSLLLSNALQSMTDGITVVIPGTARLGWNKLPFLPDQSTALVLVSGLAYLDNPAFTYTGSPNTPANMSYIYDVNRNTWFPFYTYGQPVNDLFGTNSAAFVEAIGKIYFACGTSNSLPSVYPTGIWSLNVNCPGPDCGQWLHEFRLLGEETYWFTPTLVGTSLLIFGGNGLTLFHNSLQSVHLLNNVTTVISSDYTTPSARAYHAASFVANSLYIHGGVDTNGIALSDLWSFNTDISIWTLVPFGSNAPSGRYGHTAVSYYSSIVIFGGTDGRNFFNDLYRFDVVSQAWLVLLPKYSLVVAAPRAYHSAVIYNDNEMLVYGGVATGSLVYQDFWRVTLNDVDWEVVFNGPTDLSYSYASSLFVYQNITSPLPVPTAPFPRPVFQAGATIATLNGFTYFIFTGGCFANYQPVPDVWFLRVDGYSRNSSVTVQKPYMYEWIAKAPISNSENAYVCVVHDDVMYAVGGESVPAAVPGVYMYSLSRDVWLVFNDTQSVKSPSPKYGNSANIYGNRLYMFGGSTALDGIVLSPQSMSPELWMLVLGPAAFLNSSSPPPMMNDTPLTVPSSCSPGTYKSGTKCVSCPAGQYFSQGVCINCQAGFYNAYPGATSSAFCVPCPSGYYNPTPGQGKCTICPFGTSCPIGSVTFRPALSLSAQLALFSSLSSFSSQQPTGVSDNSDYVVSLSYDAAFALAAAAGTVVIMYVLLHVTDRVTFLVKLDVAFSDAHYQEDDKPMFSRQTPMGGGCTIMALFVCAYFLTTLFVPYIVDNVSEVRSLVPGDLVQSSIFADLHLSITLSQYPSMCTVSPSSSTCVSSISVSSQFVSTGGQSLTCAYTGASSSSFSSSASSQCTVTYACSGCTLTSGTSSVQFTLTTGTSSNNISWVSQVSSGFPDNPTQSQTTTAPIQNSTTMGFMACNEDTLFRGLEQPSIINLRFTPVEHVIQFLSWTTVGYLQDFQSQTPGSTVTSQSYSSVDGMSIVFSVVKELTTLEVSVAQALTSAQLIAAIVGALSGSIAGVGALVSYFEDLEGVLVKMFRRHRGQGTDSNATVTSEERLNQLMAELYGGRGEEREKKEKEEKEKEESDNKAGNGTNVDAVKKVPVAWKYADESPSASTDTLHKNNDNNNNNNKHNNNKHNNNNNSVEMGLVDLHVHRDRDDDNNDIDAGVHAVQVEVDDNGDGEGEVSYSSKSLYMPISRSSATEVNQVHTLLGATNVNPDPNKKRN